MNIEAAVCLNHSSHKFRTRRMGSDDTVFNLFICIGYVSSLPRRCREVPICLREPKQEGGIGGKCGGGKSFPLPS